MKGLKREIEEAIRETYTEEDAELALLALSEMRQPNLTSEFADLRARVQLAILLLAKGDTNALLHHVQSSQIDWRDTLVAADKTSPDVLKQLVVAGFKVPPGGAA